MSILPASGIGDESTGFYPETINQSLRFNKPDTPYLERTFVTPSSTRKVIIATWIKPSELGSTTPIMYSAPSSLTTSYFLMGFAQASYINSNDSFKIFTVEGNSAKIALNTTARFRDTTNWQHVCVAIDTEQATSTDRVMIFFNGIRYDGGFVSYNTFPSQNHDFTVMNSAIKHRVGATSNGLHANYGNLQGYLSEFYFIDGQSMFSDSSGTISSTFLADANTLATFCEQKNGVAVPKAYNGTFGNNGCRLTFVGTGTATTGQGTTAQTNIGDDQSGEGHNFSVNGLASTDVVIDTPTNNFCTLNALSGANHNATLSEGALKASGADQARIGTFGMKTGKWYWEGRCGTIGSGGSNFIGIVKMDYSEKNQGSSHTYGRTYSNNGSVYTVAVTSFATGTSYTTGDIIGVAVDMDNGTIVWYKNGTENTNSEVTDLNSHVDGDQGWLPWVNFGNATGDFVLNFGQDSTFAGLETAQNNSDGNGNGDFYYSPPSGYFALCTDNLNEPTISPSKSSQADDHFDTITYNGSASNQTITTNFQADFLWFKERTTNGIDHNLFDSSRLHSTTSAKFGKKLESNTGDAETDSTAIVSQSTNDITLLGGVSTTNDQYSRTYVMWHWKANGGTTSTNTEGSLSCTVQANTDAGFSIVTWAGDGNTAVTLGHGLEKKPELIIYKGRDNSFSWPTWFKTFGTSTGSFINTTNQPGSFARVTSEPTATVIPNAEKNYTNVSGEKDIAYVFHSVEGYSRIGLYTGNGSTDGTFINLGFRPAWVIIKKSSGSGNWCIFDNKQNPDNPVNIMLLADTSGNTSAGGTGDNLDFLSNGFKIRDNSSGRNTNGGTYIYMAFAEQPFKFSNAR